MTFTLLRTTHIEAAVSLALKAYETECADIVSQNDFSLSDIRTILYEMLTDLLNKARGLAAVCDDGTLAGYLYFPWSSIEGFFGDCKGAYSPLYANAFANTQDKPDGMSRDKLASILFEKVSAMLVCDGVTSFALTVAAHDNTVISSFVLNGFGVRCADAIKRVETNTSVFLPDNTDRLVYRIVTGTELLTDNTQLTLDFFDLWQELCEHLEASPVYFSRWPPALHQFTDMIKERGGCFFTAFDGDKPVGYIQVFSGGENWISESLCKNEKMRHICGTYVKQEYRGQKTAEKLLKFVESTLAAEHIPYLGVDCETLNPTAQRFWGKYFSNYTYSLHRRIDERCLYAPQHKGNKTDN